MEERDARERIRILDAVAVELDGRASVYRRMAAEARAELAAQQRARAFGVSDASSLGSFEAEAARARVHAKGVRA